MVERNVGQMSLADVLVRARRGSILDEVEAVVDWAPLRSLLGKRGGDGAGNSSYPAEVLLRCLLAGIWHNLSDPALEAAIADRLSFRRFVGLSLHDQTPDHTTLWRFRQELAKDGLIEKVFAEINRQLEAKKLILKQGTLVDASLIPARATPPRKARKDGEDTPSADRDARWGRKGKKSVFGYKIHTGVDAGHTIIRRVHMTDASITDTEPADRLFCGDEEAVYGDQAYYTHARHARLTEAGIKDRLMRRPNKHHPELPPRQKLRNKLIAKIRSAVERPYAVFKEHYGLRRMRFFNFARNQTHIVLACCAYNLRRAAGALAAQGPESVSV
ncbi:IS5 family transposase [Bradyrhizobium sp. RDM4]|uniref:IS5 family transposase n=1 Tax=Bradyrhizobium sp. RDM4 TaxID=3378765 RepID=UPI0038FC0DEF